MNSIRRYKGKTQVNHIHEVFVNIGYIKMYSKYIIEFMRCKNESINAQKWNLNIFVTLFEKEICTKASYARLIILI